MPIDFRLASLEVENFRGVKSLEIEFFDKTPTYLVGGNNSGKSTLLNALALVLKGGGFHRFTPQEFDFFRDSQGQESGSFSLMLHFKAEEETALPAVQGVGSPVPVYGARVTGKALKSGRREHTHSLFRKNGEGILLSPRTPLKGETKEKYKDHGLGWKQVYAKPADIWANLPEVWLLTPDNLYRSLYEWKTGPLQTTRKFTKCQKRLVKYMISSRRLSRISRFGKPT
jgi:energy-coupling factor transporter ATP-binding protein EcfA2